MIAVGALALAIVQAGFVLAGPGFLLLLHFANQTGDCKRNCIVKLALEGRFAVYMILYFLNQLFGVLCHLSLHIDSPLFHFRLRLHFLVLIEILSRTSI